MGIHYIDVQLPDGGTVHVEVEEEESGDIGSPLLRSFDWDQLNQQIARTCRWLSTSVKDSLPESPDEVGMEFGIKITAETGTLIAALAKAGGEATLLVRLQWNAKRDAGG
jgi:hypothetical protein